MGITIYLFVVSLWTDKIGLGSQAGVILTVVAAQYLITR